MRSENVIFGISAPPPFNSQKLTKTVVTTNLDDRGEGGGRGREGRITIHTYTF